MRIFFYVGPDGDTFLRPVIQWAQDAGHEVEVLPYAEESQWEANCLCQWADVIWCEWSTNAASYVTHMPHLYSAKVIVRMHGWEAYSGLVAKINWSRVDRLVYIGDRAYNMACQMDERIKDVAARRIPNGVDTEKYAPWPVPKDSKKLAFISNCLKWEKGFPLLIQVADLLYGDGWRVHVAGHPKGDNRLAEYVIERGGNLVFDGWQDDMHAWLEDKRALICTSIGESQGMGIMEAMSSGVPALIHMFSGASEIYHKAAMLWDTPEDCRDLLATFSVPEVEDRNRIEARRFIEDHYSMEIANREIESLFEQVVA